MGYNGWSLRNFLHVSIFVCFCLAEKILGENCVENVWTQQNSKVLNSLVPLLHELSNFNRICTLPFQYCIYFSVWHFCPRTSFYASFSQISANARKFIYLTRTVPWPNLLEYLRIFIQLFAFQSPHKSNIECTDKWVEIHRFLKPKWGGFALAAQMFTQYSFYYLCNGYQERTPGLICLLLERRWTGRWVSFQRTF